jgi:hypothetical protein
MPVAVDRGGMKGEDEEGCGSLWAINKIKPAHP